MDPSLAAHEVVRNRRDELDQLAHDYLHGGHWSADKAEIEAHFVAKFGDDTPEDREFLARYCVARVESTPPFIIWTRRRHLLMLSKHPSSTNAYLYSEDGWLDIIDRFLTKVEELQFETNFQLLSTKEKFGGLRMDFLADYKNSRVRLALNALEMEASGASFHTCEICGEPGTLRKAGWWKTLCDEHEAKRHEGYVPFSWDEDKRDE